MLILYFPKVSFLSLRNGVSYVYCHESTIASQPSQQMELGDICMCTNPHIVVFQLLSRVQVFENPWTVALQAPLSMEFCSKECWSGFPFPSPGDLPDPRIKPTHNTQSSKCMDGCVLCVYAVHIRYVLKIMISMLIPLIPINHQGSFQPCPPPFL